MPQEFLRTPTSRAYLRFFLPLALQTIAQSVTHPLVAVIAAQGEGGIYAVAGMAQSTSMSFLLQTLNMGLMTTGMIFAKNAKSFRVFSRLNVLLVIIIISIQGFFSLPGPAHLLFGSILGLPFQIEGPAIIGFRAGIPLAALFMFRTRYYSILLSNKASGRSSAASLMRVGLTIAISPIFVGAGLVGPVWAYVCLTVPVALETFVLRSFALPYIRALPDSDTPAPRKRKLFAFALPLSLSSTLMVAASNILSAFIARAPDPQIMLPVYFLLMGVVNPLSSAASQMQRLVLAFAPGSLRFGSSFRFSVFIGLISGIFPLVFMIPALTDLYFIRMQNMSPTLIPLLRATALILVFHPFLVSIRSQLEGTASYLRKSRAILFSYGAYLGAISIFGFASLAFDLGGNLIGSFGLFFANIAAIISNLLFLKKTIRGFKIFFIDIETTVYTVRRGIQ